MHEAQLPHELIISDAYWEHAELYPKVPLSAQLIDQTAFFFPFAKYGAARVQRLYRSAANSTVIAEPIQNGRPIPLLERGAGLIRVVEDTREVLSLERFSLRQIGRLAFELDSTTQFNVLASEMVGNHSYDGPTACTIVRRPDDGEFFKIWRAVEYLTGGVSDQQLEGVTSDTIRLPAWAQFENVIKPPLVVGTAYKKNRSGTKTTKIIEAEVLASKGLRKRIPKEKIIRLRPRAYIQPGIIQ